MTEIKIAGVPLTRINETEVARRISLLLWGPAGCGKTTLAATAPGEKLLLNFDPDGHASIAARDDVLVADFSRERAGFCEKFKSDDPLTLRKFLEENTQIETVICDSVTNASQLALMHGVATVRGATVERPSPGAYQVRNGLTLQLVKNLLRLTSKLNRHCIFIGHEASPVTNDDGVVLFITVMLGGQLPNQATMDFSEVWSMSQTDSGKYRIAVRPVRNRRPCKTRMFTTTGKTQEFEWHFDPEARTGDGIAEWYDQWRRNKYAKIQPPK